MDKTQQKTNIKWIIPIVLTALIMVIPGSEAFSTQIRTYLAGTVFFIIVIALELMPTMFVAIALPTFYAVSGVASMGVAFGSYSGTFIWMVLGAFVLGNIMDETGLLKRIAYRIVMLMGGSFSGAVFGVYIVAALINLITFGSAWVIALPLILGIIKALGLKPGKESAIVCFAGMAGTVDSGVFMYIPGSILVMEGHIQTIVPDFHVTLFTCFIYNGIILLVSIAAIWLLLWENRREHRKNGTSPLVNGETREYFRVLYQELGALKVDEIKSLILFILILVYMIASTFTGWNSAYAFMVVPYMAFLPYVGIGKKAERALGKVNYNGLFFATSCVAIGTVGNHVGFSTWLTDVTLPFVTGHGMLFTCIVLLLITVVGNFLLTPGALMSGFGGVFSKIAAAVGIKPIAAVMLLYFSGNIIFLPHEITGYLLLYGMGYWPIKHFVKQQSFKSALYIVCFAAVIYPFWKAFGLL